VLPNATGTGAATLNFAAEQDFATGDGPGVVTIGDVNGDGKADIVVANSVSGTVSVLLNTTANGSTTPSFAAKQDFAFGAANYLALADLNGDGRPDLVLLGGSAGMTVRLNATPAGASTATFAEEQVFSLAGLASATDLNGDGTLDLVLKDTGFATASVSLNTLADLSVTQSVAASVAGTIFCGYRRWFTGWKTKRRLRRYTPMNADD
jgi:trimeric autotransporter adhesin